MWTHIPKLIVITIIIQYASSSFSQENNQSPPTTPPAPVMIPNDSFKPERSDPAFTCQLDPSTARSDGPCLLLSSSTAKPTANGNAGCKLDPTPFLGKRVRISAMVKSENLTNGGGIGMAAIAGTGKWLRFDTPSNQLVDSTTPRLIHGTTDWTKVQIVSDIPSQAAFLGIGLQMKGPGKLWLDDAKIEIVADNEPTTDDQNPHLYSDFSPKYSVELDETAPHDGRPTICITPHSPPPAAHSWFGLIDRQPDKYLGHQIRISAWMKCEGHSQAHLSLVAAMPGPQKDHEIDKDAGKPAFPLTSDWRQYEVTGTLPANAQCLTEGDFLFGTGKVWIDDMKVEVIDAPPAQN